MATNYDYYTADFNFDEFFNTNTDQPDQESWLKNPLVGIIGGAFVNSMFSYGGGQQDKDTIRYEADFRNEQTKEGTSMIMKLGN